MGDRSFGRRLAHAAVAALAASLVAACASETPAPVQLNGAGPGVAGMAPPAMAPAPVGATRQIVVGPGQSLSRIAQQEHVSQRVIIAANHLKPPYKIEAGQRLVIPGGAAPPVGLASAPLPPAPQHPAAATRQPSPDVIPLDDPPPGKSIVFPPHAARSETSGSQRPAAEPSAAEEARAEGQPAASLPHGGHLPWPVHGRVLAGYGVAAGGAHNDGINIAAPRGAPVRAVDAGIVAYAGNELRGYGNLVLVKHASGFISAYAHCDELLVKRGDKVTRGQVIAKVGATGGVGEPQLHFELRRGKRAVDPREFLAPATDS